MSNYSVSGSTWAELAAAKLKKAGDEAKHDYEERRAAGIGDNEPEGSRFLEIRIWESELDTLENGLRELAQYLQTLEGRQ
jgi:hypothetical protein